LCSMKAAGLVGVRERFSQKRQKKKRRSADHHQKSHRLRRDHEKKKRRSYKKGGASTAKVGLAMREKKPEKGEVRKRREGPVFPLLYILLREDSELPDEMGVYLL